MFRTATILGVTTVLFSMFFVAPNGVQAGLLSHWTFDEATGASSAADSTGSNNATPSGGVTFGSTGVFNNAVTLDGVSGSYLTVPYIASIPTSSFTFAAWVNRADGGSNPIFTDWSNPWAFWFTTTGDDPKIQLRANSPYGDMIVLSPDVSLPQGDWAHVAATWDRATKTANMYVNGYSVGQATTTKTALDLPANTTHDYHIGWKQDSGDTFKGSLDELWVFDEALSADQVRNLHATNDINIAPPPPEPYVGVVSLSNLFDDAKSVDMTTAMGSDTQGASADISDLGISAIRGDLTGPADLNGNGVQFDFKSVGGDGAGWGSFWNDSCSDNATQKLRLGDTVVNEGFGMHADGMITFDLVEIRNASNAPADLLYELSAQGGLDGHQNSDSSTINSVVVLSDEDSVLGGYIQTDNDVDGDGFLDAQFLPALYDTPTNTWSLDTTDWTAGALDNTHEYVDFDFLIDENVRFLTFGTTRVDSTNDSDHGIFAGGLLTPRFDLVAAVPEPSAGLLVLIGIASVAVVFRNRRKVETACPKGR